MASTVQLFKEIGPVKLSFMAVVALAVMAALAVLALRLSAPATVPLFSNLSPEDSARIASKLERMGLYYEMGAGGAEIRVPVNKVHSARMQVAQNGLPSGSATVGYEIFDKTEKLGVSSFVYNVNLVRALEGELGRTIGSFDKVAAARVHLVLPRRDLFSRSATQPSASVVLQMRGIEPLQRQEIDAVAHLVAAAVPGLDVKRITIVDTQGRPFKKGAGEEDDPDLIASSADEYRMRLERRMKETIEDLLSRSVGVGRVEAQVNVEADFDHVVTDSESFDPEGQVARSVQTTEQRDNSSNSAGGEVSVATNLPAGQAQAPAPSEQSGSEKLDSVTNYEVSKTTRKFVKGLGEIRRLSIAILIDGAYAYDSAKGKYIYSPRPQEELDKLAALARSSVGFSEKRGDTLRIENMEFSKEIQGVEQERSFEWLKRDLGSIVQTLMIGIVITLVILLIVRPIVSKAFEMSRADKDEEELMRSALTDKELEELAEITAMEEEPAETEEWLNVEQFEDKMKDSSVSAINDIIERHPQEAVTVLRGWMERE
jgi:flagellar M-ring protein FliF